MADGRVSRDLRIGMLSPIAWRTPPRHYGPWERVVSLLTEGLVARGVQVTLFATADSLTRATLHAVCPRGYEEDATLDAKVWECLHVAAAFERASQFDILHNHFDFLPLSYAGLVRTPVVTTIHGFSSDRILPVYETYADRCYYVSISDADRSARLRYVRTVHHGIDLGEFTFQPTPGRTLAYFGRIHPDKGAREAIEIARRSGLPLVMAGVIQDGAYFRDHVEPHVDGTTVQYLGSAGPELRDQILGQSLALLHPIAFDEPFGLSVVEALACGTPVIAFARGSMPELIRPGVDGFLVPDVEGALAAVQEVGQLDRRACRQGVAERFSVDRMVNDYLDVYERVLMRHEETTPP